MMRLPYFASIVAIASLAPALVFSQDETLSDTTGLKDLVIDSNNLDAVAESANARGWHAEKESDGSLLLYPSNQDSSNSTPPAVIAAENTANADSMDLSIQANDLHSLKTELEKRGWHAQWDENGSLLLFQEAQTQATEIQTQTVNGTPQPQSTSSSSGDIIVDSTDMDRLQSLLTARGWHVEKNNDGSLNLSMEAEQEPTIAASDSGAQNSAPTATYTAPPCQFDSFSLTDSSKVELPVNTWKKAHSYAATFLRTRNYTDLSIGKIREVNNLYIISIVKKDPPYSLEKQLVINKSDGRSVVFP